MSAERELWKDVRNYLQGCANNSFWDGGGEVCELLTRIDALLSSPPASEREGVIEETTDSAGDWQCRDYADGWITFPDRKAAERYQRDTGAMMRYRRFYPAKRGEEGG